MIKSDEELLEELTRALSVETDDLPMQMTWDAQSVLPNPNPPCRPSVRAWHPRWRVVVAPSLAAAMLVLAVAVLSVRSTPPPTTDNHTILLTAAHRDVNDLRKALRNDDRAKVERELTELESNLARLDAADRTTIESQAVRLLAQAHQVVSGASPSTGSSNPPGNISPTGTTNTPSDDRGSSPPIEQPAPTETTPPTDEPTPTETTPPQMPPLADTAPTAGTMPLADQTTPETDQPALAETTPLAS